jgi:hypothetical protein
MNSGLGWMGVLFPVSVFLETEKRLPQYLVIIII